MRVVTNMEAGAVGAPAAATLIQARPSASQAPAAPLARHPAETGKRVLDIAAALLLLLCTAPLNLVLAALIKLEDGGPVLLRQPRVGRRGALFAIWKFRSMRVDAEAHSGPVWAQPDDPRVTRIGRWMRRRGFDEIPQAWNVLCGEMSFVGPRPERPEFVQQLEQTIPSYHERHAVRPGITGWAQVNLAYAASLEHARRKVDYDLDYLRRASLGLDVAIMLRTLRKVARAAAHPPAD